MQSAAPEPEPEPEPEPLVKKTRVVGPPRPRPGSETLCCYLAPEDIANDEDRVYSTYCNAGLGDHRSRARRLIKFSLGDLNDPSRINAARVKAVSWGLSQYSGRLVIMAHGHGPDEPYDLGATAEHIPSSERMAEIVRGFLGHLRTQRPAMLPTSQIDLVVCAPPLCPCHISLQV